MGKKLEDGRAMKNCTRHEVNLDLNEQIVVCYRIKFISMSLQISNKTLGKETVLPRPLYLF